MGANFETRYAPPGTEAEELQRVFAEWQESDRYENGHSYSGGFGMATGLTLTDESFPDEQKAHDWLLDNCEKWNDALTVWVESERLWLIGAWCAC